MLAPGEPLERYVGYTGVEMNCDGYEPGVHTVTVRIDHPGGGFDEDRFELLCD